jgi:hypothetical protein
MPIIINEFEIIPEAQSEREPAVQTERQQPKPAPDPEAIIRVERLYRERMRRLRAT